MKNAKKVLAMVIVLALAISMAIPVSAGSITINGAKDGSTYTAYKMADLSYDSATNAYKYTVADGWDAYFATDAAKAVYLVTNVNGEDVITEVAGATSAQKAEAAKQAVAFAKNPANGITAAGTATESNGTATISVDDGTGYYCVDSNLGVICSIGTDGDNADVAIDEKNDIPTIDKVVGEVGSDVDDGSYVYDASIGDTVQYTITIEAKAGATNYVVTDNLDKGLTYNADSFAFTSTVAGITVEDGTPAVSADGTEIIFTVENEEILNEKGNAATITITYTATVNADAVIDGEGNDNNAELAYGENNKTTSIPETPTVYTWSFDIFKYREVGAEKVKTALKGAGFTLVNAAGKELKFTEVNGVYKYAGEADATKGEKGTELLANNEAKYLIEGLDSGNYTVKETTVPAGFNKANDVVVTIDNNATATSMSKTISVGGEALADNSDVVEILNNAGAVLPSTGGTGTVIFVTVGSILVLAMGVLLVVRKRMSKVVYTR